jgi:hypothetical protein
MKEIDQVEADRLMCQQLLLEEEAALATRRAQEETDRLMCLKLMQDDNGAPPVPLPQVLDDRQYCEMLVQLEEAEAPLRKRELGEIELRRRLQMVKFRELQREKLEHLMCLGDGKEREYVPVPLPSSLSVVLPTTWNVVGAECARRCFVDEGSPEYTHAMQLLLASVNVAVHNVTIERIQNPEVYEKWSHHTHGHKPSWYFHGCRSADNESSIIEVGFRPVGAGTWFSALANYSHNGFSFIHDKSHKHHLFLCQVCRKDVARDVSAGTVLVVGKHNAYPTYVVSYNAFAQTSSLVMK